ncbi:hypothetical protein YC2023_117353 [Brassica napus]
MTIIVVAFVDGTGSFPPDEQSDRFHRALLVSCSDLFLEKLLHSICPLSKTYPQNIKINTIHPFAKNAWFLFQRDLRQLSSMATILSILGLSYQYLHWLQGLSSMVCQFRVSLEKDAKKQEQMWESQQKQATDKIYFVCSDLGGFVTLVSSSLANGVLLLVKTRSKPIDEYEDCGRPEHS